MAAGTGFSSVAFIFQRLQCQEAPNPVCLRRRTTRKRHDLMRMRAILDIKDAA